MLFILFGFIGVYCLPLAIASWGTVHREQQEEYMKKLRCDPAVRKEAAKTPHGRALIAAIDAKDATEKKERIARYLEGLKEERRELRQEHHKAGRERRAKRAAAGLTPLPPKDRRHEVSLAWRAERQNQKEAWKDYRKCRTSGDYAAWRARHPEIKLGYL